MKYKIKWQRGKAVKFTIAYPTIEQAEFIADAIRQSGDKVIEIYQPALTSAREEMTK